MTGYTSTLDRRLTKLENSKLGTPAFAGCGRWTMKDENGCKIRVIGDNSDLRGRRWTANWPSQG
jgi:hypothetical protein